MLSVANLECVRGDRRLFTNLAFSLEPQTLLQVHGPNGSGKTTLLRTVCGLVLPVSGEITWQGTNIRTLKEDYLKEIFYLGHHNALKDEMNALENLQISTKLSGDPASEDSIINALRRMGLKGREDLPTKVLSQGQKRRVALARLLLTQTSLWILDEPFTALDVNAVKLLADVIAERIDKGGMVILTTHQEAQIVTNNIRHLHLSH